MQEDSYSTLSDLFSPSWWHLLLQVSSYTDADDGPGPWPWGVSGLDKLVSALERLEGPVAMQLLWKMLTFSISLTIIFITGVFVWVFNRQTQIRPSVSQNLHLKNKNINKNMPMTLESMGSCDSQEAQSQSPQRRKKRRNRNRSKKKKKTKKEDENENENENDSDDSVNVKNDEAAKEKRTDAEERAMSSSSKSKFNSIRSHDSNSNSIDDHWSHRMKKIISSNLDLQALERNETKNADTNAKERVEDQDQDPISPLKPPSASTSTSLTNHHKEVRHHLFKSIKRLKVFSYLSDEAFLESLAFMEWIHLKEEGRELFTEEGDADGNGNGNGNENENENENEKGQDMNEDDDLDLDDPIAESNKIKADLVSYLEEMTASAKLNKQLTCGLDCTDAQREVIYDLITSLATIISPANLVTSYSTSTSTNTSTNKKKKMSETNAMGDWDLLYTCSHAMLINRSLSGLGRSTSAKAQFQGLRKRLSGSKYLGTAEYIETFGGSGSGSGGESELEDDDDDDDDDVDDDYVSFEVIVTGEWYFEEKNNFYTNQPAPCLKMELEKVIYGPTTNGADQWSSLGPVKLTDFLYLDDDLMILRGNANTSSLFVYRRAS